MRALIVDDSPVMRKVVERALRQAGIELTEVLQAGNGSEALERPAHSAPRWTSSSPTSTCPAWTACSSWSSAAARTSRPASRSS